MAITLDKLLENYRISPTTGFAMDHPSPTSFKDTSLSPWTELTSQIPTLLASNTLRSKVDNLPILSPDLLDPNSIDEYRLAFVCLATLANAYIWGNLERDKPSNILPASIAVPLVQVAHDLQIQPAFCYAAGSIWLYSEDPITRKEFCVASFTGTKDEEHFNITTHNVERIAGRALKQGLIAARCAGAKNAQGVVDALNGMTETLQDCHTALMDMRNGCDPDVFYSKLRPYLTGSKSVDGGVLYQSGPDSEEGDGTGVTYHFPGASAAQSPIFQSFDMILRISHASNPGRAKFVEEMRKSMPAYHAQFLEDIKSLPSIAQFIEATSPTQERDKLRAAYNATVEALTAFRSEHVKIVTLYVLSPSKRAAKAIEQEEVGRIQGSGGSGDLFALLKGMRDDTKGSSLGR